MNRANFILIQEDATGSLKLNDSINTSNLTALKNGSLYSTTFHNNGNGSYHFTASGAGIYSVRLNGTVQDEFRDVYIGDTDILTTSDVDNTTVQINNGVLEIINGDTLLREEDVVDSLTNASTTAPLSANMGNTLSASIATKEDRDPTILKEDDVINDFTTGGTYNPQSAQSLLIDFQATNYLKDLTTYNAAIRELDRRIGLITIGGLYKTYLQFGYGATIDENASSQELSINGAINGRGCRMSNGGIITNMSVTFVVDSFTKGGSGGDPEMKFSIYKNGSQITSNTVIITVGSTGIKSGLTSVDKSFAAGDTLTIKWSFTEGIGDSFNISNIAAVLEVQS